MTNPNILKGFNIDSETMLKSLSTDEIYQKLESNFEKGLITEELFLESLDILEKGGKKAMIGEIRQFAGRPYIRTEFGWKFYGKGGGKKVTEHLKQINVHHDSKRFADKDFGKDEEKKDVSRFNLDKNKSTPEPQKKEEVKKPEPKKEESSSDQYKGWTKKQHEDAAQEKWKQHTEAQKKVDEYKSRGIASANSTKQVGIRDKAKKEAEFHENKAKELSQSKPPVNEHIKAGNEEYKKYKEAEAKYNQHKEKGTSSSKEATDLYFLAKDHKKKAQEYYAKAKGSEEKPKEEKSYAEKQRDFQNWKKDRASKLPKFKVPSDEERKAEQSKLADKKKEEETQTKKEQEKKRKELISKLPEYLKKEQAKRTEGTKEYEEAKKKGKETYSKMKKLTLGDKVDPNQVYKPGHRID